MEKEYNVNCQRRFIPKTSLACPAKEEKNEITFFVFIGHYVMTKNVKKMGKGFSLCLSLQGFHFIWSAFISAFFLLQLDPISVLS